MISMIISLLMFTFEYFTFYFIMCKTSQNKMTLGSSFTLLTTILCIAIASFLDWIFTQEMLPSILMILVYSFTFYINTYKQSEHTHGSSFLTIFLYSYSIIIVSELVVAIILLAIPTPFVSKNIEILGSFLSLIVCILFYYTFPNKLIGKLEQNMPLIYKVIITNACSVLFFMSLYFKIDKSHFFEYVIVLCMFALAIIYINISIFYANGKIKNLEVRLKKYDDYMPIIEALIDDVKAKQHEYENIVQSIRMLPYTHDTYDSLKDALLSQEISSHFNTAPVQLLKLNLKLIVGFIYAKYNEIQSSGKELQISISDAHISTSASQYDIVEILGILLDNANEATLSGDIISLYIGCSENRLILKIKNKAPHMSDEVIHKLFIPGYSTKKITNAKSTRGYGLPRIQRILNKYDGHIFIENISEIDGSYIEFEVMV